VGKTLECISAADRAALRRGTDPWEVRAFYELLRLYADTKPRFVALTAPLIAELREETDVSLGELCRKRQLSERRLRRLLAARDRDDLVHQLRSVIRILGRTANPDELVRLVRYWGDRARRGVAQDYFQPEESKSD